MTNNENFDSIFISPMWEIILIFFNRKNVAKHREYDGSRAALNALSKFAYGRINYYHLHLPGSYIRVTLGNEVSIKFELNFNSFESV